MDLLHHIYGVTAGRSLGTNPQTCPIREWNSFLESKRRFTMNSAAIISIVFGLIILGSRVPFFRSTEGAVDYYKNLAESDTVRRFASISIFLIALVMIMSTRGSDQFSESIISFFGWFIIIFAGIGVFANFLFASLAKEFAVSMIGAMDDELFVFIGVFVGAFFLGLGFGTI